MNFRIASHPNKIKEISEFYINILNLEILSSFKNHNNYDGVFIGKKNIVNKPALLKISINPLAKISPNHNESQYILS